MGVTGCFFLMCNRLLDLFTSSKKCQKLIFIDINFTIICMEIILSPTPTRYPKTLEPRLPVIQLDLSLHPPAEITLME